MINNLTDIEKRFKVYIYECRWALVVFVALLIFTYGSSMFNFSMNVDEERSWMLYSTYKEFAGLAIRDGRFGLVALAWLTMTTSAFPYWPDILMVVFLLVFCVLVGYVMWRKGIKSSYLLLIAFALFLTYPSHSYMMAFSYMMPSIVLCYSLNLFAALFINEWINEKRFSMIKLFFSVAFLTFSMSTYQSMTLCFVLTVILINLDVIEKRSKFTDILFMAVKCVLVILLAYLVYRGVNGILEKYYATRSLVDSRLGWGKDTIPATVKKTLSYMYEVLIGKAIYGGAAAGISLVLAMLCGIYRAIKIKRLDWFFLMPLTMVVISFAQNIALGAGLPVRTMQSIPLLILCLWAYMAIALHNLPTPHTHINTKRIALMVCVTLLLVQIQAVNRLTYTSIYRYEREMELITKIALRIEKITQSRIWDKPIVFLGQYPIPTNNKQIIEAETISGSAFCWDSESFQVRKHLYFSFLGYPYPLPDGELIDDAHERGIDMPLWPNERSVREFDEYIIVRLGIE